MKFYIVFDYETVEQAIKSYRDGEFHKTLNSAVKDAEMEGVDYQIINENREVVLDSSANYQEICEILAE